MSSLERNFLTWLIILICFDLIDVYAQQATQCGVRPYATLKRRKRVIGGNIARINAWPWLVNMIDRNDSRQYCSGVIIDRQWILTAAHCFIFNDSGRVTTLPLKTYKYIVADHKFNVTDPYEYTVEPSKLFIHPKYKLADNVQPGDYDIAIIELKRKLKFSKQVKKACLPTNNTRFDPTATCYLAGWGNVANTDDYNRSNILREVKLRLVPLNHCNSKTVYNGSIPKRFRCAGYPQGGKDGCYGDSGAPLQCYVQSLGGWTVAGIMSWGKDCGTPNQYGVYTDVQHMWLPFIKLVLKGSVDRLTTYHKRRLCRFRKKPNFRQKSLYQLFTKNGYFTDIDLVRNLQFTPAQITLLKSITMQDYAFVMDKSAASLTSSSTRLNKIVSGFQQHSKKFENYVILKIAGKMKKKCVADIIKLLGIPKANLLNAGNTLKQQLKDLLKKISRSVNTSMSG